MHEARLSVAAVEEFYSSVSLFRLLNMLLQMRQIKVLLVEEFKSGFRNLEKPGKKKSHGGVVCSSPYAAFQST